MKLIKIKPCDKKSKGQSLIEYALILAMVTVIAVTALQLLGQNMSKTLKDSADAIQEGGNQVQEATCKEWKGTWDADAKKCILPESGDGT